MDIAPAQPSTHDASPQAPKRLRRTKRLIKRLTRISSSPTLQVPPRPATASETLNLSNTSKVTVRPSVSCITLESRDRVPTVPPGMRTPDSTIFVQDDTHAFGSGHGTEDEDAMEIEEIAEHGVLKAQKVDFFQTLPDEVKVQVLSYLNRIDLIRCSGVSRSWQRLCYDGQLWKEVDISQFLDCEVPPESIARIISRASPFIRTLNVRGCTDLGRMESALPALHGLSNLQNLNVEGAGLMAATLKHMFTSNKKLKSLKLTGNAEVNHRVLNKIAYYCKDLERLDVSHCQRVSAHSVVRVLNNCQSLHSLMAQHVEGFHDPACMNALYNRKSLKHLVLTGCRGINDESLRILIQGQNAVIDPITWKPRAAPRALTMLNISRCPNLTDFGLEYLIGKLPSLQYLSLARNRGITNAGLKKLLPTLPNLLHLDLEELTALTDSAATTIVRAPFARNLRGLILSCCENISEQALISIVKNCISLTQLDLDSTAAGSALMDSVPQLLTRPSRLKRHREPLELAVFDCAAVPLENILGLLSFNTISSSTVPPGPIVKMRVFYKWQEAVDEHTRRVQRGHFVSAKCLEKKLEEEFILNEGRAQGARRRWRNGRGGSCAIM